MTAETTPGSPAYGGADALLVQTADDVFAAVTSHEALQAAEREGWAPDAWRAVAETGLPWVGVPEQAGGEGGDLADALAVLRVAGYRTLPLPLAETGVLGGWLLASAGLPVPRVATTVVSAHPEDDVACDGRVLTGTAHRVPWAGAVERLVLLVDVDSRPTVVSLPADAVQVDARADLAGEPRGTVHFDRVEVDVLAPAGPGVHAASLHLRGALTRVVLVAGALDRLRDLTVRYTGEREQFGKPIGRFQAVQQHLAHNAQQAALVGAAAEVAGREVARGGGWVEVACAKVLVDEAVAVAARAAHQAHGAMGLTQEYALHHVTRRLWSWRREHGTGARWSAELGRLAAARSADDLYPLVTGGSSALAP
jgi:acyl-CoA dehydrogenase